MQKIDRASLADVVGQIVENLRDGQGYNKINPCVVWNSDNGEFSIQSELNPMHNNEIILGNLNVSPGFENWFDGAKFSAHDNGKSVSAQLTNKWIIQNWIEPACSNE
jgi:hypothetical protein